MGMRSKPCPWGWIPALGTAFALACAGQIPTSRGPAGAPAPGTSPLPACANAGTGIDRPAAFPARFPLPPGTVITSREARSGGRLILHTLAPLDVRGVALFFERELPRAGFQPGPGESEPGEAEASYSGMGTRGRWRAIGLPGCPGVAMLTVLAGP